MTAEVTIAVTDPPEVAVAVGPVPTVAVTAGSVPAVTITGCTQGPPGPKGDAGDAPTIVAAENLGGHRVIALSADGQGVYADYTNATALAVLGISTGAAAIGTNCYLLLSGDLEYPAAGLTSGLPVFLGATGLMTQTPPTTGWVRSVGAAVAANRISVNIGPAYWAGA